VAGVERQHKDCEEAGRETADAVDRGVAAELEEPRAEWPRGRGLRLRFLRHEPRWYVEWWPCRAPFRCLSGTSGVLAGCSTWWGPQACISARTCRTGPRRGRRWSAGSCLTETSSRPASST